VGAPKSPTAPPREPAIDVSDIGGGRSRVSISASQGVGHHRHYHRCLPRFCSTRGALPLQLPVGHCRYPVDRVPPHVCFKLRQGVGRASMHYHVPYSSGPHLPAEVGSGAAICSTAPDLASLPRWALALPCFPQPQTSPPNRGGLLRYHVSRSPRPLPPAEVGSGTAMCPRALDLTSLPRWATTLPCVP
jgi:hypothetical protein